MKQESIPGGTVTLREEADLTPRQRKYLKDAAYAVAPVYQRLQAQGADRAVAESSVSAADMRRIRELREATVCALVESWTLDEPLPTEATIADLDTELYDALVALVEGREPDKSLDFSVNPDPKATTDEPSDSSGDSSAETRIPSQTTSPSDGSPSSTGGSSPE